MIEWLTATAVMAPPDKSIRPGEDIRERPTPDDQASSGIRPDRFRSVRTRIPAARASERQGGASENHNSWQLRSAVEV
ncbi:hypothetical protein [Mesorhizobium tianshanense]|uniref:hypothetical protein n=1 Tax=Mesorhizobium tianshanense TaxID=39844 RepID=UPI0011A6AFE7|nr:hypothetical protein [Mesorhizobium tianshanense]